MVSRFVCQMDNYAHKKRKRMRRYLFTWIAGCTALIVVAYTQLLDYYLDLGVDLRTLSLLERVAEDYVANPGQGLPTGPSLAAYVRVEDIPAQYHAVFDLKDIDHGDLQRHFNLDRDNDDDRPIVETGNLCLERRCELLFLFPYQADPDTWLFLLQGIVGSDAIYDGMRFTERVAIGVGAFFILVFFIGSFILVRSIHGPIQKLERWSSSLSTNTPIAAIPELHFEELDSLANRMNFAFERLQESVEKEKLFLRHASHELRTPLAILASNVELLDKLSERPERSDAEQAAFVRQYQALDDVRLLIETLLWLNRQSESPPQPESLQLRGEIDKVVKRYQYLLGPRPVSLSIKGDGGAIQGTGAAVHIVLSNLVRNAFQHTTEGEISITVAPDNVSIENTCSATADRETADQVDEYGFGLGLELVARVCERLNWHYSTRERSNRRITVVNFSGH